MARGESEAKERGGTGLAIWAIFGVACLSAALLVVWATSEPEEAPHDVELAEPFAGVEGTLRTLTWRGCDRMGGGPRIGPGIGPTVHADPADRLHEDLTTRGYTTSGDWSEPRALPLDDSFEALLGACGVVAVASEPSGFVTRHGVRNASGELDPTELWDTCNPQVAAVGVCGGSTVHVDGGGLARVRVYLMPGLTEGAVASLGTPAEVALAHAEGEVLLARANWRAHDELVSEALPPRSTEHRIVAPVTPSAGCVPWVAVGTGVGDARVTWLGRMVQHDPTQRRFLTGVVSCNGSGLMGARTSELIVRDDNRGGTVWFRPYDAGRGPGAATAAVTTVGQAEIVGAGSLALPRTVEDRYDD